MMVLGPNGDNWKIFQLKIRMYEKNIEYQLFTQFAIHFQF